MKQKIHPKYYENCRVTCACGNSFETGSTRPELDIDICSKCHPVYTGKEKVLDKAGRVERFKKMLKAKKTKK